MSSQAFNGNPRRHSMPPRPERAVPWDPTHVDATPLDDEDHRVLDRFPGPPRPESSQVTPDDERPPIPLEEAERRLLTRFPDVPRSREAGHREVGRHDGRVPHGSRRTRAKISKTSYRPRRLPSPDEIENTSFLLSDSEKGDSDNSTEDSDLGGSQHSFHTQISAPIPRWQQDLRPPGRTSSKKSHCRQERSHRSHTIHSSQVPSSSSSTSGDIPSLRACGGSVKEASADPPPLAAASTQKKILDPNTQLPSPAIPLHPDRLTSSCWMTMRSPQLTMNCPRSFLARMGVLLTGATPVIRRERASRRPWKGPTAATQPTRAVDLWRSLTPTRVGALLISQRFMRVPRALTVNSLMTRKRRRGGSKKHATEFARIPLATMLMDPSKVQGIRIFCGKLGLSLRLCVSGASYSSSVRGNIC